MHLIFIININGLAKFVTFVTLIAGSIGRFYGKMRSESKRFDGINDGAVLIVLSDKTRRHLARYIITPMLQYRHIQQCQDQ